MPVPGELSDDDVFGASPQAAAPPPSTGQRALANVRSGRPATEGLRGADGTVIPRKFDDLPSCVAAFKARQDLNWK